MDVADLETARLKARIEQLERQLAELGDRVRRLEGHDGISDGGQYGFALPQDEGQG